MKTKCRCVGPCIHAADLEFVFERRSAIGDEMYSTVSFGSEAMHTLVLQSGRDCCRQRIRYDKRPHLYRPR